MELPIQNLSQICDEILAAAEQDAIEAASKRTSPEMEREDTEGEPVGQDVREQGEGGAASADGACEEQNSEPGSEDGTQSQSSDRATSNELTRPRKPVTRTQPSTSSASPGKLKRNQVTNSAEDSSNKRQRRYIAADLEEFKKKDISAFFKQTALIPKDFHQPEDIYGTFSERCSTDDPATMLLLTRLFFWYWKPKFF